MLNNKRIELQETHCSRIQIAICNVRDKLAQFSRKNRESTKNVNVQTAINIYFIGIIRYDGRNEHQNEMYDDKSQFTPAIFHQQHSVSSFYDEQYPRPIIFSWLWATVILTAKRWELRWSKLCTESVHL